MCYMLRKLYVIFLFGVEVVKGCKWDIIILGSVYIIILVNFLIVFLIF